MKPSNDVLVVVSNPKDWPLEIEGAQVVSARQYLTSSEFSQTRGLRVFNLSRSYKYQSQGYYVSLLAAARRHKPLPSISTILDLRSPLLTRYVSEELEDLINKSLHPIQSDRFTLSIYFGHNLAKRHDRLSARLFKLFPAPLLRAEFARDENQPWQLRTIRAMPAGDLPDDHHDSVLEFARDYLSKRRHSESEMDKLLESRYELAILWDENEEHAPSTEKAIQKFVRAAEKLDFGVEVIGRDDYGRIAEFDALFIRETTNVTHHTYRFARRAAAEGVVVIDDPESILLCTNKVFLAELLTGRGIPIPKTLIVHRDNVQDVEREIGFPCILKEPDSAFSLGVKKASNAEEFAERSRRLLKDSELFIAQEFLPTAFDWRIGVLDREAFYACRYHMSGKHWQIVTKNKKGEEVYGRVEAVDIADAPPKVVETAVKAANLIGDGLYGVDLKETENGKVYVIEVNDNPNMDAGYEDAVLKDELYMRVMRSILRRIESRKKGAGR